MLTVWQVSWSATTHILTTLEDSPGVSDSPVQVGISQADGGGELDASDLNPNVSLMDQDSSSDSDWIDSDSGDELHDEMDLDEEVELEQVAMEDGVSDGFDSNAFDGFKF